MGSNSRILHIAGSRDRALCGVELESHKLMEERKQLATSETFFDLFVKRDPSDATPCPDCKADDRLPF